MYWDFMESLFVVRAPARTNRLMVKAQLWAFLQSYLLWKALNVAGLDIDHDWN